MKTANTCYLSLGSNLGDRVGQLRLALEEIARFSGTSVSAVSPLYETEPWGGIEQPHFLNCCCALKTKLTPTRLFKLTKETEAAMGRRPAVRWGPRCIDIDIILYEGCVSSDPKLTLPHPRLGERAFVLVPLRDIGGNSCLGFDVAGALEKIGSGGVLPYECSEWNSVGMGKESAT